MGSRLLFALGFFTLFSLAEGAGAAVPATCLSTLPAEPGTPVFTFRLNNFSEVVDLAFWRQACTDDSRQVALLMRATPVSQGPFLCAGPYVIQAGFQTRTRIRTSTSLSTSSFCGPLFVPITFVVDESFGEPTFIEETAMTLIWTTNPISQIEIPPGDPGPPSPPSLQVVITGCPCRPGTPATARLVYANPGPTTTIDLRLGAHLPDGGGAPLLNDFHTIPPGASETVYHQGPVPDLAPGTYRLEAALLDAIFGVTLSRHSVEFVVLP